MRPITTFVRHNGIKALLTAEKGIRGISQKRLCGNLYDIEPKFVGTSVKIIKETNDTTYIAKYNSKGKIDSGDFKLLVTTDLHLGDDMALTRKALSMLAHHVADEKPDLILFTGDVVLSACQQIDAIQFGSFMEKMGVYWAYVFGNHEAREEKEYHKYFLMKNLSSFPLCLSKIGDENLFGYGNFIINIMNSETSIKQSLFCFDSGRDIIDKYRLEYNVPTDFKGYDFIKKNQMNWYRNNLENFKKEYGDFKSMMFMHIPIPEFAVPMDFDEEKNIGTPNGNGKIIYGGMYESVGCSRYNSGLFKLIKELDNTQAVFSGHDHVNDYCALYDGVYLVYAQCGGYETYTLEEKTGWDEDKWVQGVTMVDIHGNCTFELRQRFNRDYLQETI